MDLPKKTSPFFLIRGKRADQASGMHPGTPLNGLSLRAVAPHNIASFALKLPSSCGWLRSEASVIGVCRRRNIGGLFFQRDVAHTGTGVEKR